MKPFGTFLLLAVTLAVCGYAGFGQSFADPVEDPGKAVCDCSSSTACGPNVCAVYDCVKAEPSSSAVGLCWNTNAN